MKNQARNVLIALLALMFILSITRLAKAVGPSINLPPGTVNATFNYPGSNSYWSITLSNVPSGYDVTNAIYVGWCCDETFTINNGATLGVKLYSSYDPLDPYTHNVDPGDWNKVDYIINNKQGTADDVQAAIWHYIDSNGGNQADPDVIAMEAAADANGGSFVPTPGQLLAVVLYKEGSQTTFIEVIVPAQNVQLTTTSAYDSPTPTSGSYTPGTSITASVTSPVAGPVGTRYVCTGWTGMGDVLGSGTGTTVTFTISQDSTITWNWKTQYYLTANNGGHGTASGENWYDAGTPATFGISPTTVSDGTGVQYVFTGWSSSDAGGYTGSLPSAAVTMNNPITETAHWKTQYYLTVKTDPPGAAAIGGQGWYDAAATPTLTAPPVSGSYRFWGWDVDGTPQGTTNPIMVTMGAPHTATAHYSDSAVGGEWAPINTVQLLAPYVALALASVVAVAAGSWRLIKKRW
jgi:uncharacterized repeat protein (TIGR02543 family)